MQVMHARSYTSRRFVQNSHASLLRSIGCSVEIFGVEHEQLCNLMVYCRACVKKFNKRCCCLQLFTDLEVVC
jgi:hypothetical protein